MAREPWHTPDVIGQPQTPLLQTSLVQALPSVQLFALLTVNWHVPVAGLQASSVQGFPSSQVTGVWTQPTPLPVCILIVAVVLPDIPGTCPPTAPTKSIR